MTIPCYALVVGVSNYQSNSFDSLPAAQGDALYFAKSLMSWGIPEENITVMCSDHEKMEAFEQWLNKIAAIKTPFQFLFYFCGHGYRTPNPIPESFLVFSDSEIDGDQCKNGVNLEKLFHKFNCLNATNSYIFIDACKLRLNSILNPKLMEEVQGIKESKKALFCLLSSGIFPSFENADKRYGYFTEALIKALSGVQHKDRSPVSLFQMIQNELNEKDLPEPEMYNIGTHVIDFLPTHSSYINNGLLAKQKIHEDGHDLEALRKAITAIYSCGLFINETLFRRTFSIDIRTLNILEKIGLIFFENGCWRPYESLLEIAENERVKIDRELAISYWCRQLEELPGHFESALNLVLTIKCFGYQPKFDPNLLLAYKVLNDHKSIVSNVLKESVTIFEAGKESYNITPSAIFLAEMLLDLQEFDLVKTLLKNERLNFGNPQAAITYSHLLWRIGQYSECIKETTYLMGKLSNPSEIIQCRFHRGSSHYFLGNWVESEADFSYINQKAQNPCYIGWSRCLLGTITGIRGIDVAESKLLIESGIRILTKSEDFIGAWVGWNNLGEIMWKAGDLRSSDYYLGKALEISKKTTNTNALLETLRNLLQLEMRRELPNRSKIIHLLERIEQLLMNSVENFEAMQIYNTLSTTYYYLKNYDCAHSYLKKAVPVTSISKEYYIYTLSNLSLHYRAHAIEDKALGYLEQAKKLAIEGNNKLALKQIEFDHALCFKSV